MTDISPAPWTVAPRRADDQHYDVRTDPGGWLVAICYDTKSETYGTLMDPSTANARLIAAAPTLLTAALTCVLDLDHYQSTHGSGPDRRYAALLEALGQASGLTPEAVRAEAHRLLRIEQDRSSS